ncbi:MAG: SirA family protein [Clostridia bacterium]|jgi:TusA-related sulfurtransferase|nr:SirA family protein [Clostridia bacterium]
MMAEFTLDCLGEACPVPLMRTEKKISELKVGDVLIVSIDHSCAMKNVPEWARKQGYNVEIEEVDDGEWELIIEKTK